MTPWLEYGMTEDEWRQYEDEYADWNPEDYCYSIACYTNNIKTAYERCKMSHYYLTIVEIETGKTVYENGFINRHNVAEELADWNPEDYCYSIEEIKVPDYA